MNTKAKHAPGRGRISRWCQSLRCVTKTISRWRRIHETGHARLIAAAPELLAACDLALGLEYDDLAAADARVIINDNHKHRTVESMAVARANLEQAVHRKREKLAAIRAAISKAKGEA